MHPILFLSYDGCLHPDGVHHVNGEPEIHVEGHGLFEHAELLARLLEPYPDLRIVLSTPWARIYGLERAKEFLPAALRNLVLGTTHEFCGDFVEWAGLTEFDQVMRYVEGHRVRTWLALSCDRNYWPEIFQRNRVWLNKCVGLGDERVREELTEKLERMHRGMPLFGAGQLSATCDANTVRKRWDMAMSKLADARIPALSASTRFQAAYDALCCCASICLNIQLHTVSRHLDQMLEQLPTDLQLLGSADNRAIALLLAWQSDDYWEPKHVTSSDVDAVLNFAEIVLSVTKTWLPAFQ